jgi:hypothetical protein
MKETCTQVHFSQSRSMKSRRTIASPLTDAAPEEFVATLAELAPDRYQHGIRYFGLLATRSNASTWAAVFALLRQKKRSSPRRLGWAFLLKRDFGKDPNIDRPRSPDALGWTTEASIFRAVTNQEYERLAQATFSRNLAEFAGTGVPPTIPDHRIGPKLTKSP